MRWCYTRACSRSPTLSQDTVLRGHVVCSLEITVFFSKTKENGDINRVHFWRSFNLSKKKTEPSVLQLSFVFEKTKVRFLATYDAQINFPVFFFFSPGYALPVVG